MMAIYKITESGLVFDNLNLNLRTQKIFDFKKMANHKSALKRIRSNEAKRLRNRYQHKTTRTFIRRLRASTDKTEAGTLLTQVSSMVDKLAKRNIIHKNKAANLKSSLTKHVASLG